MWKDQEKKRVYEREYHLKRYHERRSQAMDKLGRKCVKCGSEENLELDHVDPSTKSFDIAKMWSVSRKRYEEELQKCQLLCKADHKDKSDAEQTTRTHGSYAMYRREKCRCDPCTEAGREYMRQYWKRKSQDQDGSNPS